MLALFEYFWSETLWVPQPGTIGRGVFSNPVSGIMPYFRTANSTNVSLGNVVTTASATISLSMAGVNKLVVSSGYIHVRSSEVNAVTTTALKITGTDGISTIVLGQLPVTAPGDMVDWVIPFVTDFKLNSISVLVTLGGAIFNAMFDVEAAGGG